MSESKEKFSESWSVDCQLMNHVCFLEREAADKLTGDWPVTISIRRFQDIVSAAYARGFHAAIREYDRMKAEWEQRCLLPNATDHAGGERDSTTCEEPAAASRASVGSASSEVKGSSTEDRYTELINRKLLPGDDVVIFRINADDRRGPLLEFVGWYCGEREPGLHAWLYKLDDGSIVKEYTIRLEACHLSDRDECRNAWYDSIAKMKAADAQQGV